MASTKIGALHHIPHNLLLVFASRMDTLHSLSLQIVSVPLAWGWRQTLEPKAGQGKQIQSLRNSHFQTLVLSAPNGLRKKSPDFKGHSPVRVRRHGLLFSWLQSLFSNTTRRESQTSSPTTMYLYVYASGLIAWTQGNNVIKPLLRRKKEQQLLAYRKMVKVEPEPVENWKEKGRLIKTPGLLKKHKGQDISGQEEIWVGRVKDLLHLENFVSSSTGTREPQRGGPLQVSGPKGLPRVVTSRKSRGIRVLLCNLGAVASSIPGCWMDPEEQWWTLHLEVSHKLQIIQRNLRRIPWFLLVPVEGCPNIVATLQILGEEMVVGWRKRALSQLMLGEETGCTERNILNARAGSQRLFWNLTWNPVTGASEQDNPLMGSRGFPDQGSKQDHEERQPGQGRTAKSRPLTRPWESDWPRTGGRGGKNSTSVHMGSFLLDTECVSWSSRLCVEMDRDVTLYSGGRERAGLL